MRELSEHEIDAVAGGDGGNVIDFSGDSAFFEMTFGAGGSGGGGGSGFKSMLGGWWASLANAIGGQASPEVGRSAPGGGVRG